jgi:hypothetical protein
MFGQSSHDERVDRRANLPGRPGWKCRPRQDPESPERASGRVDLGMAGVRGLRRRGRFSGSKLERQPPAAEGRRDESSSKHPPPSERAGENLAFQKCAAREGRTTHKPGLIIANPPRKQPTRATNRGMRLRPLWRISAKPPIKPARGGASGDRRARPGSSRRWRPAPSCPARGWRRH